MLRGCLLRAFFRKITTKEKDGEVLRSFAVFVLTRDNCAHLLPCATRDLWIWLLGSTTISQQHNNNMSSKRKNEFPQRSARCEEHIRSHQKCPVDCPRRKCQQHAKAMEDCPPGCENRVQEVADYRAFLKQQMEQAAEVHTHKTHTCMCTYLNTTHTRTHTRTHLHTIALLNTFSLLSYVAPSSKWCCGK